MQIFFQGYFIIDRENYAFPWDPHNYLIEQLRSAKARVSICGAKKQRLYAEKTQPEPLFSTLSPRHPPGPPLSPLRIADRAAAQTSFFLDYEEWKFLQRSRGREALQRFSRSASPIVRTHKTYINARFFLASPLTVPDHANRQFPRRNCRQTLDSQERTAQQLRIFNVSSYIIRNY